MNSIFKTNSANPIKLATNFDNMYIGITGNKKINKTSTNKNNILNFEKNFENIFLMHFTNLNFEMNFHISLMHFTKQQGFGFAVTKLTLVYIWYYIQLTYKK